MDRIELLKNRRAKLLEAGKETRSKIAELIDADSFVELSSYSFSKNEFYGEGAEGEGVITGYATVEGNPCCVVAQNGKVLSGGVSKANCDKICKTLNYARNNAMPVIYLLDTKGVQIGEGVAVLEGISSVLNKMGELMGDVPQFAVVDGDCFGSFALVAAACDFTFVTKEACIAYAAPSVIATSKIQKGKNEVGGVAANAKTGVAQFVVENMAEVKSKVAALLDLLPQTGCLVVDSEDDLNRTSPNLNEKVCADCLAKAVFDEGTAIEINKGYADEVACMLGRIGGISAAVIMFKGGENGVELTPCVIDKINDFVCLAEDNGLPIVNFVNAKGISNEYCVSQTGIMRDVANLFYNYSNGTVGKVSVVYGKAVGLGYSLFAAKNMGYDYTCSFANAKIALFDSIEGAYVEFDGVKYDNEQKFAEKYADENQDPINAARGGYIDDIIEPQFVRQYVISALQSIVR